MDVACRQVDVDGTYCTLKLGMRGGEGGESMCCYDCTYLHVSGCACSLVMLYRITGYLHGANFHNFRDLLTSHEKFHP